MDYVDWFYNNLTVRTPYYVMAINTSNPDLISYVRPISASSNFMKEGLTVEKLGVAGKTVREINEMLVEGAGL